VAGGDGYSVGQPSWAGDGALRFVWDVDEWWQPFTWRPDEEPRRTCAQAAEFHGPDWGLGQATLAEMAPGVVACRWRAGGLDHIGVLDEATGTLAHVDQECVSITAVVPHDGGVAWLGRSPTTPATLWWAPVNHDGTEGGAARIPASLGAAATFLPPETPVLDPANVSTGAPFTCEGSDGRSLHGIFYAPRLGETEGPAGVPPPLIVSCHSGPTGSVEAGFDVVTQFFTTRGFAVAAVDYAGSTGYGREFRRSLFGAWGEVDTDDCAAAARFLAAEGRVDGRRMAVRGSSAGGMTALNALVRARCFAAAVSWYGVTDLLALEASTHDFESRYNHRLVGPLPETEDRYRQRSPVNRVADMAGAVLLLYGLDDPVVPASQARAMAQSLRSRGVHCEEHAFAGEAHGFRSAETIRQCLLDELDFYRRVVLEGSGWPGPEAVVR
jgi:dipeptidyl aminopeptidase/acylaminoacyl peptidase